MLKDRGYTTEVVGKWHPGVNCPWLSGEPPEVVNNINYCAQQEIGSFAVPHGKWNLILSNGSGGRPQPQGKPFEALFLLYDIENDPEETNNVMKQHQEV